MKEGQESVVTNEVQCLQRRSGGPCYNSWPSRAHPECRAAHEAAKPAQLGERKVVDNSDRMAERLKRREERLRSDDNANALRESRKPKTPMQAKAMHDVKVLYDAWAYAEDTDGPPVPLP